MTVAFYYVCLYRTESLLQDTPEHRQNIVHSGVADDNDYPDNHAFFLWQKPLYYVIVFLNINLDFQELTDEQILYFSS